MAAEPEAEAAVAAEPERGGCRGRGGRRAAERHGEPERRRRTPAASTRRAAGSDARVPFVGLTGGLGAGQVDRARRAGAPRRGDAVHRRRRPRALRVGRGPRRGRRSLGRRGRARGGRSTARRSPRRRSPTPRSAPGWRACSGRASRARVAAFLERGARPPTRRRRRPWSRRRCSSRRAWRGSTTPRSPSSPTRTSAPQRAAARGHEAVDERAARQLSQEEKADRATYIVVQRRHRRGARAGAVGGPCKL